MYECCLAQTILNHEEAAQWRIAGFVALDILAQNERPPCNFQERRRKRILYATEFLPTELTLEEDGNEQQSDHDQ